MSNLNIQNGPNFLLPAYSTQDYSPEIENTGNTNLDSALLWNEKYTPSTIDELAIRKQKLTELQQFLASSAISSNRGQYKLLILTGPTGCGKSTSIRVLANSLDYDIIEWSNNPQVSHSGFYDPDYEPTMTKFSHFLKRSIETISLNTHDRQQHRPKIILLDDLPDLTTTTIKHEFQSILKSYIASNYRFLLIIVLSDTQISNSNRSKAYYQMETQLTNISDILTHDIKTSGKCAVIEFNPVTKANLKKAMNRVLNQEARYSNVSLSSERINDIIEQCHGDIRCAINTMQFHCTPSRSLLPQKRKKNRSNNNNNQQSISSSNIHCRENPLTFYHAIGKVLYAKREESGALESKPTDILNKCNADCDSFIGWVYSNYHYFTDSIIEYSKTMDNLCDADMLGSMGYWKENVFSQYQMLISMHGVMLAERKGHNRRLLEFSRPDERYFKYNRNKMLETPPKIRPIVNIQNQEPKLEIIDNEQNDKIEMFSEDEFDDIYGDDLDASIFDALP
ncbi:Rad17 cell cycle checkpoint protein-domain-containing protein [Cunninghamella echinulata]|nr:Rad17 cell cycle checkpoint protein-domain-containing protein [Cunninghamella echinulata]